MGSPGLKLQCGKQTFSFPYPSRPAVALKLPLLQCLLAFFPEGRGAALTTLPNLALKLKMSTSAPLLPHRPGPPTACNVANLTLSIMTTVITTKKMYVVCFLGGRAMLPVFSEET